MAIIDLPSDFKFKHIMSHTLPGFFSAITLCMLIDVWSPLDVTSMILGNIGGFAAFLGFIFIAGTIIGIILDGIHHIIIEDNFFDTADDMVGIRENEKEWMSKCDGLCCSDAKVSNHPNLTRHYSFKTIESKLTEINNFIIEDYYSYSEFYSNTFLALIPFSFISPDYLLENFQIPWLFSVSIGYVSAFVALVCIFCSYNSYKSSVKVFNSIMLGYVKDKKPAEIKGKVTVSGDINLDFKGA